MRPSFAACSFEGGLAVIALCLHLQDRGVVYEPVDDGEDHGLIGDDPARFADRNDVVGARAVWNGGLCALHEYVAHMGRLHIRYKTATWLAGVVPNPFMRSPMPKPRHIEIDTLYTRLKQAGIAVIDQRETRLAL